MAKFTVSNSALNAFFGGCAHRYPLFKQYSTKDAIMPPPMKFGIAVHKAIDVGIPDKTTPAIRMAAERLLNLADKNGYQILATEVKHFAPLTDEINVFGLIDVLALTADGKPVIIDWKTGGYPWETTELETGELVTMKAVGWQGAIYTMPPFEMPIEWDEWPREVHYLVVPTNGNAAIHKYHANEEDLLNLVQAATIVKEADDRGWYPKNVGYECRDCLFMHACWKTPNWERYYDVRRGAREDADDSAT